MIYVCIYKYRGLKASWSLIFSCNSNSTSRSKLNLQLQTITTTFPNQWAERIPSNDQGEKKGHNCESGDKWKLLLTMSVCCIA